MIILTNTTNVSLESSSIFNNQFKASSSDMNLSDREVSSLNSILIAS